MVLAILLIGLALEETLHLYSLAFLEEFEECLVIILDPGLEALDGRRGNLHATLLLGGLDGYAKTSDAALLKVSNFCVLADTVKLLLAFIILIFKTLLLKFYVRNNTNKEKARKDKRWPILFSKTSWLFLKLEPLHLKTMKKMWRQAPGCALDCRRLW